MAGSNSSSASNHPVCYPPMTAVSNGILQGDIPFNFALPLLIFQIVLVLLVTRTVAALFRPFKQPRVLAEIIGGVLLGPTALGRNKLYMETVFPTQSLPLLETVANIGLMFFIFMVGLGLDVKALKKTGKNALLIGLVGISAPFIGSIGLAELLRRTISKGVNLAPLVVFMGCPISMSAFSVLVRILGELKMLNSDIAKLAVPSGALNDVAIYTLLAVGVATAGSSKSPLIPVWVLLCGVAYGSIMLTVVRKLMGMVAMRATKQGPERELCVCITLVAVLLAGFVSDAIGVHPFLGTFLLGLVIPKDTPFPKMMTEKIEDFVTGLLLPLFFASSGLKTNLAALHGISSVGFLVLFFATAATGKIVATFVTAKLIGLNTRGALVLGFLMNTKGLAVLIVLNVGRDLKVLTDEVFAILVLTCLLTSFVTMPMVTALCKEDMESVSRGGRRERSVEGVEGGASVGDKKKRKGGELRIIACAYEPSHHLAFANLLEATRGGTQSTCPLKIYALHLLPFSDNPSSLFDLNQPDPHRPPSSFTFPLSTLLHKPSIRTISLLTKLDSMHHDICKLASKKRSSLILLPYHRSSLLESFHSTTFHHTINQKVLDHAPCSVGIFVDQASTEITPSFFAFNTYNVMVFFFGGPDDREALSIASRMVNHPGVVLKIVRVVPSCAQNNDDAVVDQPHKANDAQDDQPSQEELLDDDAISSLKSRASESSFDYKEISFQGDGQTLVKDIEAIIKDIDINLYIIGRGPKLSLQTDFLSASQSCLLGVVGDVLVSTEHTSHSCILVVQQNPH